MKLIERSEALASTCRAFPWLGIQDGRQLIELIRQDLGSEAALEEGVRRGNILSRAVAPSTTLHIVSGNTPHAALQTLVRGLLLGGKHWMKLPTSGLPEVTQFLSKLPEELSGDVELSEERRTDWIERAECVVVFGSDATIAEVHSTLRADQRFIPHGHKFGFGFLVGDADSALANASAEDICAFDQRGCLSPVAYFVEREPLYFGELLAGALARYEQHSPRREISSHQAANISLLRNVTLFRNKTAGDCHLWASEGSTAWTVLFDTGDGFPVSPGNRFIIVRPMPDLSEYFNEHRKHLSAAGTNSMDPEFVERLFQAGFQRVCPIGKMQEPSALWHHDGYAPLGSRVRWIEWETNV